MLSSLRPTQYMDPHAVDFNSWEIKEYIFPFRIPPHLSSCFYYPSHTPLSFQTPFLPHLFIFHFTLLNTLFLSSSQLIPHTSPHPTPFPAPMASLPSSCSLGYGTIFPSLSSWSSLSVRPLSSQARRRKVYWSPGNARVPLKVKVNKSKASCWTTKPKLDFSRSGYQLFRAVRSQGTRHLVILSRKIWDDYREG